MIDVAAWWPVIRDTLIGVLSSLLKRQESFINIETLNAQIIQQIELKNQREVPPGDRRQIDAFLRDFLESLNFIELRLNQISLRLDDVDEHLFSSLNDDGNLEARLAELAATKKTFQRSAHLRRNPEEFRKRRRSASAILEEADRKVRNAQS